MSITIDDIRSAADALASQVIRTPSIDSRILSELCGTEIVLKLENMQITGSFKPRGAYMKLTSLSDDERAAGVVVASAGTMRRGLPIMPIALASPPPSTCRNRPRSQRLHAPKRWAHTSNSAAKPWPKRGNSR